MYVYSSREARASCRTRRASTMRPGSVPDLLLELAPRRSPRAPHRRRRACPRVPRGARRPTAARNCRTRSTCGPVVGHRHDGRPRRDAARSSGVNLVPSSLCTVASTSSRNELRARVVDVDDTEPGHDAVGGTSFGVSVGRERATSRSGRRGARPSARSAAARDERREQRVRSVGTALELGVRLRRDEERVHRARAAR